MAAMAPVMTTRNKLDQSSPWVWAENGSDAYYGVGDAQIAMIGQQKAEDTDTNARLIINAGDGKDHILFKTSASGTPTGRLQLSDYSVKLGIAANGGQAEASNSVMIGNQALGYGDDSVAIGTASRANTYSTAVGDSSEASNSSTAYGYGTKAAGTGSVSLGYKSEANGSNSIAIGNNNIVDNQGAISIGSPSKAGANHAISLGMNSSATGVNSIAIGGGNESIDAARTNSSSSVAIGTGTTVSSNYSIGIGDTTTVDVNSLAAIAIGHLATVNGNYGISMGYRATGKGTNSITIGNNSSAEPIGSIAIGNNAQASIGYPSNSYAAIAIGLSSVASGAHSIAIGGSDSSTNTVNSSEATGTHSIAIGYGAKAPGTYGIAIGDGAKASGLDNIAIGTDACRFATGNYVTCLGSDSGPQSYNSTSFRSKSNVIYIGNSSSTVYIPGNLVVGKEAMFGSRSVDDHANYKVYLKAGNKGAGSSWVYLGTDDYKGGDDNFWRVGGFNVGAFGPFSDGTTMSSVSDRRLKYVGKESTSGLEKIKQLKVFNYTFKKDEKKTPHVGVIAQDLQKVFPDAVTKAKDGFLRIRFEDMFYAMINAIKELDSRITALEKENQQMSEILKQVQNDNRKLQDDNRKLQNDNKKFEARLNALEARLK